MGGVRRWGDERRKRREREEKSEEGEECMMNMEALLAEHKGALRELHARCSTLTDLHTHVHEKCPCSELSCVASVALGT